MRTDFLHPPTALIVGYVDQSDPHPIYDIVEGTMDTVCFGITSGGDLIGNRFIEISITLMPDPVTSKWLKYYDVL